MKTVNKSLPYHFILVIVLHSQQHVRFVVLCQRQCNVRCSFFLSEIFLPRSIDDALERWQNVVYGWDTFEHIQ